MELLIALIIIYFVFFHSKGSIIKRAKFVNTERAVNAERGNMLKGIFNVKVFKCIAIIIIAIIVITQTFTLIPAGSSGVVLNFGGVTGKVLSEGLHIKAPIVQQVVIINNQVQKSEVEASSASKDLQTIVDVVSVNYRVGRDSSAFVYQNIGKKVHDVIIAPAIQESVKSVTAKYTAEELITKRQQVGLEMKLELQDKVEPFGIVVEAFNIVNFEFSKEFNNAIEAKQTAQQQALKAEQDLTRIKIEAEQIKTKAAAEAESNKLKNQSITSDILKMLAIEKWDGKMPAYYGGGDTIFSIPMK